MYFPIDSGSKNELISKHNIQKRYPRSEKIAF